MRLIPEPDTIYYLAGPMTGYPDFNYPFFTNCAATLRAARFEIRSPHEIAYVEPDGRGSLPYPEYIKGGLELLFTCNALILLPGWPESSGAQIELYNATKLAFPIHYFDGAILTRMSRPKAMSGQKLAETIQKLHSDS